MVSFTIDDQTGFVQPCLDEPRNWLIDSKGVHKLEQIGYAESSDWVERTIESLEKLTAQK